MHLSKVAIQYPSTGDWKLCGSAHLSKLRYLNIKRKHRSSKAKLSLLVFRRMMQLSAHYLFLLTMWTSQSSSFGDNLESPHNDTLKFLVPSYVTATVASTMFLHLWWCFHKQPPAVTVPNHGSAWCALMMALPPAHTSAKPYVLPLFYGHTPST